MLATTSVTRCQTASLRPCTNKREHEQDLLQSTKRGHSDFDFASLDQDYASIDKLLADSPPFILTNEECIERTHKIVMHQCEKFLTKHSDTPTDKTLYIGFSGWFNYSAIVWSKVANVLLVDVSTPVYKLHQLTIETLKTVKDRFEFIQKILEEFGKEPGLYYRNKKFPTTPENIRAELENKSGWLGSDESFAYIQNLAKGGKITCLRRDLCDKRAFLKIHKLICRKGFILRVIYVANIGDWLRNSVEHRHVYRYRCATASLKRIIHLKTLVIDASLSFTTNREQRVFKGVYHHLSNVRLPRRQKKQYLYYTTPTTKSPSTARFYFYT